MVAVSSVCLKLDHRDSRIPYCCCCCSLIGTVSFCEDDDKSRDAPDTDVVNNNSNNAKESEHERKTGKRAVRDHWGEKMEGLMIDVRVSLLALPSLDDSIAEKEI